MQITAAKSCNRLFITCVGIQILINTLFHLLGFFYSENLMLYLCAGALQMLVSAFLGLYIRRKNKHFLLTQEEKCKPYIIATLVGWAVFLIIFCCPDIIAIPYTYVSVAIHNAFGINRLVTVFDCLSILICLGCVFFRKRQSRVV